MNDLTIFLVGDGERSEAVRDLVAAWTVAGLTSPSVWVTPSRVHRAQAGPAEVSAELLGVDGRQTEDLFHVVGRRRLDLVRVVVAQLLTHGDVVDGELVDAAHLVADQVRTVLPRSNDDARQTRLHRANVVIPVSGLEGLSREAVIPGWDVNTVVSPEDRPDVDRGSVYVRSPGNFDGHAASALAAIGGVFPGVPAGALDAVGNDSTSHEKDVVLSRVSVRAVVGDDVVRPLAGKALDTATADPAGPASLLDWARPAADPQRLAGQVGRYLTTSGAWMSGAPRAVAPVHRRRQSFGSAFVEAARFNVRTVGTVARWATGSGKTSLERRATGAIVGHEGDTLVQFSPQSAESIHADAVDWLASREESLRIEEVEREAATVALPSPETWSDLRSLSFAVVDGADLPDEIPEPRYAGLRELLPPASVVADPMDVFEAGNVVLVPTDPAAARRYERALEENVAAASAEVVRLHAAGARPTAPVEPVEEVSTDAADTDEPATEEPDVTGEPERTPEQESARAPEPAPTPEPPRSPYDQAVARQDALLAAQGRLREWQGRVAGTVLWRLADDVGRRKFAMRDLHDATRPGGSLEAPPHERLIEAQKTLQGWWRWTLIAWAALTAIGAIVLWQTDASWETWLTVLLVLLVLALGLLVAANHRFYKAVRTYEWEVSTVLERRRRDSEQFVHAGQESSRLDLLYRSLVDWAQIIGWVLHHPWVDVAAQGSDLAEDVVEALPAATGVARPETTEDALPTQTVIGAVRRVYRQGWGTARFQTAYTTFREASGVEDDSRYLSVDLDNQDSPVSPRRQLLDFWRSGAAGSVLTDTAVGRVREAVEDGSIPLPTRRVTRLGRYGDGEALQEAAYFQATVRESTSFVDDAFTPLARTERRHYTAQSSAWVPRVAGVGRHDGIDAREATGRVAVRVDVSRRLAPSDLALFGATVAEAPTVAGTTDDDAPWA